VGDAEIEGAQEEGAAVGVVVLSAEVVPETEGDDGEFEPAVAASAVERGIVVAGGGWRVRHGRWGVGGIEARIEVERSKKRLR